MHVIYFDEVKYQPPVQSSYWVGGLAVEVSAVNAIEAEIRAVARELFSADLPVPEYELHAKHIFHGNANCKKISLNLRLAALEQMCIIIRKYKEAGSLTGVYARIIPENIQVASDKPSEIAFMYFLEQADLCLQRKDSHGVLIGDEDKETAIRSINDLALFKRHSTRYARGRKITRIVDCVHYAKSHHSRLIQLADHYLWSLQMKWGHANETWHRKRYLEILNDNRLSDGAYCRHWPSEGVWYR